LNSELKSGGAENHVSIAESARGVVSTKKSEAAAAVAEKEEQQRAQETRAETEERRHQETLKAIGQLSVRQNGNAQPVEGEKRWQMYENANGETRRATPFTDGRLRDRDGSILDSSRWKPVGPKKTDGKA